MKYLTLCFLVSCSLLNSFDVTEDFSYSIQKVCLSSRGKGRLVVGNRKYVFSYDSDLNREAAQWKLALNFPLRKTEFFELDWSQDGRVHFSSSLDDKLLRENRKVNPKSLDHFTQSVGLLIKEIIELKTRELELGSRNYIWETNKKSLKARAKTVKFNADFRNMVGKEYFGLMQITYSGQRKQQFRMDLVVKECFFAKDAKS